MNKNINGSNNPNWKGGRTNDGFGYILIYNPDHPFCNNLKYVREHRLIMEQYLSEKYNMDIFILPYFEVHHINGIKDDNRIENLMLLTKGEHSSITNLGKHKDMSDRRCFRCKSNKTAILKPNKKCRTKTPLPHWYHLPWDQINWYCNKCYNKEMKKRKQLESPSKKISDFKCTSTSFSNFPS